MARATIDQIAMLYAIAVRGGVSRICHWGPRPKAESEGGVLEEGQQPSPHQLRGLGPNSAVSSPSGVRGGFPIAQRLGFPLFSALRMTSPNTTILLIADCRAAIGVGKTPVSNGVGTNFRVGLGEDEGGPKGRERGIGFLGRGQPAPHHQLGGLRERCKVLQRGPGGAPAAEGSSCILSRDCFFRAASQYVLRTV